MKLNSKLTGGLAWAGLVVVLAVPSADMLTKPQGESASAITSDMDAIRTASVEGTPAVAAPAAKSGADPVDTYISSGKKLPSYISDAPTGTADAKPAPTVRLVVPAGTGTSTTEPAATEVAAVEPAAPLVAPVPYPASKRPSPVIAAPVETAALADEPPLIIDETVVARREEAVARVLDEDETITARPRVVTGDELEEWDSGSLAEYLERRGMMSEGEARQANNDDFDDDGFFLDEGPNNDDRPRLIRRARPRDFFFF